MDVSFQTLELNAFRGDLRPVFLEWELATAILLAILVFIVVSAISYSRSQAAGGSDSLERPNRFQRKSAKALSDDVALLDRRGRILGAGGAFLARSRLPLEQVIGQPIWTLDGAGFDRSFWYTALNSACENGYWQMDRLAIGEPGLRARQDRPLSSTYLGADAGAVARLSLDTRIPRGMADRLLSRETAQDVAPDAAEFVLRVRSLQRSDAAYPGSPGSTDRLTGICNRRAMKAHLETALMEAESQGQDVAVVLVDLDRFGDINSVFGDMVGDKVLAACAQVMMQMAVAPMKVARTGGDEFALMMPNTTREEAARFGELILDALGQEQTVSQKQIRLSASAGVAVFPEDADTYRRLIQSASLALAAAKDGGRGQLTCFSSDGHKRRNAESLTLELELRQGLRRGELTLHYQPLVRLGDGQFIGAEALLRWHHPKRGLVMPADFVPMALDVGLRSVIDRFVLEQTCQQIARWQDAGFPMLPVSINLSLTTLLEDGFVTELRHCLKSWQVPKSALHIEVIETVHFPRLADAHWDLEDLQDLGVELALDDFGTGYSSLAMLKDLPVSRIKIDRRFVRNITEDAQDDRIVSALIKLGRDLGLSIVAEGIETEAQRKRLQALGCTHGQGYLFGRPVAAEEFAEICLLEGPSPHALFSQRPMTA